MDLLPRDCWGYLNSYFDVPVVITLSRTSRLYRSRCYQKVLYSYTFLGLVARHLREKDVGRMLQVCKRWRETFPSIWWWSEREAFDRMWGISNTKLLPRDPISMSNLVKITPPFWSSVIDGDTRLYFLGDTITEIQVWGDGEGEAPCLVFAGFIRVPLTLHPSQSYYHLPTISFANPLWILLSPLSEIIIHCPFKAKVKVWYMNLDMRTRAKMVGTPLLQIFGDRYLFFVSGLPTSHTSNPYHTSRCYPKCCCEKVDLSTLTSL